MHVQKWQASGNIPQTFRKRLEMVENARIKHNWSWVNGFGQSKSVWASKHNRVWQTQVPTACRSWKQRPRLTSGRRGSGMVSGMMATTLGRLAAGKMATGGQLTAIAVAWWQTVARQHHKRVGIDDHGDGMVNRGNGGRKRWQWHWWRQQFRWW